MWLAGLEDVAAFPLEGAPDGESAPALVVGCGEQPVLVESFAQCLGCDGDRFAVVAGELLGGRVGGVGLKEKPFLCQPPDLLASGPPLEAFASASGCWCLVPAPGPGVFWLRAVGCGEVGAACCDGGGE